MAYQFSKPKPQSSGPASPMISSRPAAGNRSAFRGLLTLLIVIIIVGGGLYLLLNNGNLSFGSSSGIPRGEWQAVFLTNGQVYFGQVTKVTDRTVTLKNIYYLQVVTQPLQRSQEGEAAAPADQEQPTEQRLTLIKLGNEIHGPSDEMAINRDHVVIIEDLKGDSRVVQAINDYVNRQ